jgi:outer membrane protein assembly factor BamB
MVADTTRLAIFGHGVENSRMTRSLLLVLTGLFLTLPLSARTWKQAASGKEIEAELIKVEDGKVHLRLANGRVGQVEILSLSLADQEFIAAQQSSGAPAGDDSNWPGFRGPNGDGISPDTGLLDSWPSDGPKKLWVYENGGMGYSGFSVVDGKLYSMGTRGDAVTVFCVDIASGEEVWSTGIGTDDQQGYSAGWGHGPRSTPTVSEGHVYAIGPKGAVACLDAAEGKKVWSKHLKDDFGGQAGGWGFSASPFIDGPNLVLAPGGNDAGLVCLDKKSGSVVWKASDVKPGKAEYATVVPAEINGVKQYIRLFQSQLVGVAAEDGKLLWSSPWEGKTAVIPTPIVDGNEIYVTSGYGVGCKLVKVGSDFSTEDVWINKTMKNHHGGVVKVGDKLYGFSDGGGLICQDWASGEMVWNEKGQYTSKGSVHVADGHLYALNEGDGTLILAEVSPDGYKQKGQFTLDPQSPNRNPKGKVWTHPLVIGGKLYLRDQEYIVCYDVSG